MDWLTQVGTIKRGSYNMNKMRNKLKEHIRKNMDNIKISIDLFHEKPYDVRNFIAEKGLEYTPDQLNKMMGLIKELVEEINNE